MRVEGQSYSFPSDHVSSISREPHSFVRLNPPDKQFSLVYDSRLVGAQTGPGVPRIFSVNDEDQSGVEYSERAGGVIVCRRAVHPNGGCGTMVDHGSAQWAVLFPLEQLGKAEAIVNEALAALNEYRD